MFKKLKIKINWRKIFSITFWILFMAAFIFSMGFVQKEKDEMLCKALVINIDDSTENGFVEQSDIEEIIRHKSGNVTEKPMNRINTALLESVINNNPFVLNAEVFSTIEGRLVVEVKQRNPVVRIINSFNESFYIDEQGKFMPLNNKYAARIPVANGNITTREVEGRIRMMTEGEKKDTSFHPTELENIFMMADYINHHEFWNAQVEQIYLNGDKEFELIPRVGNQTIIFGDGKNLENKFDKLFLFYKDGMSKSGWNQYSTINISFKDQVVCTKN
jgi:cell division protein FtsQ